MKTTKALVMVALTATLTSFAYAAGPAPAPGQGPGTTPAVAPLTQTEIENILYMHEEEKLARDVYLALSEMWDCPIFANIAVSEQRHADAVGLLITKYDLDETVGEDMAASFTTLYNDLVEQGSTSLLAALAVGQAIEEMDIADLKDALAETEAGDVTWVFENLLRGSTNHLSAFNRLIANGGICPSTTCWRQATTSDQQAAGLAAQGRGGRGGKGNGGQGNGNGQGTRQRRRDGSGQQDRQRKRDGSCAVAATV